ncbi:hypothetical protein RRF57_004056 [Xylaria bambusicola]|uniref:Uncharacterized protein n=1 Tax=Xylaria bambusicola TaxID=326684 RepID=A0AAN7Z870_9PEZI
MAKTKERETRNGKSLNGLGGYETEKIPELVRETVPMTECDKERDKERRRVRAEEHRWRCYPISTSEKTSPDLSEDDVVSVDELDQKRSPSGHGIERTRPYPGYFKAAVRYLRLSTTATADGSRSIPSFHRRRDSAPPLRRTGSTGGSSSDDVVYEPPLPRKTYFTHAAQGVEVKKRNIPLKPSLINDKLYGEMLLTPPQRPAATSGV